MVVKYIGKRDQRCQMCAEYQHFSRFFLWEGMMTKASLEICLKCAKREIGSHRKRQAKLRKMYE
mgnify:CR=1 FL=1